MATLYFLDADEFTDVSAVAAAQPGARVERLPGYVTVTSDGPLVVDRRATGVRHAVWYSALAAVGHGRDIDVRTPGGLRITGIATGPGTPDTPLLVCLPGGSYTARYFDVPGFSLLDVAEANGFTTIALDRPGYGGSDPLPADERTFARNAEVLDEAIAALWAEYGAARPGVVIISHSIGSAITVHIAARQPA